MPSPDPKPPTDATPTPAEAEKAHAEELLDEALEESFPASDPIAIDVTH